ncbi:hypothetical protein BD413DRAFT_503477 [Trametes elegans]|nr:hypothetical protein BD413DRAFT_503477 [Trametes elegans]
MLDVRCGVRRSTRACTRPLVPGSVPVPLSRRLFSFPSPPAARTWFPLPRRRMWAGRALPPPIPPPPKVVHSARPVRTRCRGPFIGAPAPPRPRAFGRPGPPASSLARYAPAPYACPTAACCLWAAYASLRFALLLPTYVLYRSWPGPRRRTSRSMYY